MIRLTLLLILTIVDSAAAADGPARWIDTVMPGLFHSSSCWSNVELQNLGSRVVMVEIEPHRESGALVPLAEQREMNVTLHPGERTSYRLQINGETTNAWVKVREKIPSPSLSAVVAVSGKTECVDGNELRTAAREVAYPMRSPWFSEDLSELRRGEVILMVNTSEHTVTASACYSNGSFFAVPDDKRPVRFEPLCSTALDVPIPPFGSREFPVERGGNSHFALKTRGDAIVLQMLRISDPAVRLYTVDSTITFGSEAPQH